MDAWSVRRYLVTVASFFLFTILVFVSGQGLIGQSSVIVAVTLAEHEEGISLLFIPHRKLLHRAKAKASVQPSRIGEDSCGSGEISVSQDSTGTLPNGIPAYRVEISNTCASGCSISKIHLSCGWFSSVVLINPKVFKRLSYDNCLVNNGKSLPSGGTVSFKYANTFRYPLSVTSVLCT